MQKWKCIIVDDEPPATKILVSYVEALEYMEVVGVYNNAFQALEILNSNKIDLMFLDIKMPEIPGTQMLKTIQNPPKVIFTTAHKDYAVEAFELDAVDYLLKPVSIDRFLKAVNKFCHKNTNETEFTNNAPGFLYFRADRKMVKVFLKTITYIESYKDYVIIHRQNESDLKIKYSISSVENMLPQNLFLRIHRSYIVSIKKVTAFSTNEIEIGKAELPIGRSYHEVYKKLTGNNLLSHNSEY